MAQAILRFLQSITSSRHLIVALVSMFPLIELKGAIPIGQGLGLDLWTTALIAYVGSTLIIIPVFFLLIPVFNLLKKIPFIKKFVDKVETMLKNKADGVAKKAGGDSQKQKTKMLMLGLLIFVAIPVPLTGVWTGAAIAVFLNMKFKESILPLALGNFIAGSIVTLLTFLFRDYANIIIDVMFVIAIVMLIVAIIKVASARPAETDGEDKKSE